MTDSKLLREARTYVKTIAGGVRRPLDARDRARMLSALAEHGVKLDAAEHGDAYIAARYDAEFSEGDHPRDEHGRFAASEGAVKASAEAAKVSVAAMAKGSGRGAGPAHGRAMAAHNNAANMHITAARAHFAEANTQWPGRPLAELQERASKGENVAAELKGAEHVAKVHEELEAIRPHQQAINEMKTAKKIEEKANPKPVKATDLNVSALAAHIAETGGGTEFSNRVAAVHAPHIQRTAKAGLVEPAGPGTLRLTASGHAAVTEHLKKEATRLTHPYYNTPRDEQARGQVAAAITKLAANPPKRADAADRADEWSDAAREAALEARRASAQAKQASTKATKTGKPADHQEAARLHTVAEEAHQQVVSHALDASSHNYAMGIAGAPSMSAREHVKGGAWQVTADKHQKIADDHNAARAEHQKIAAEGGRATTVSGGVPGRPQTSGMNAIPAKAGTAFNRNGEKVNIVTPAKESKTGASKPGFVPQPGDHPKLAARMKRYPVGAKVTTASSGALYTPEHAKQHYGTVVGHERSTGRVHVQFENGQRRTVDPGSPATGVFLDRVHGK